MDAERDILLGLLAFQAGAIDADQLAESCAGLEASRAVGVGDRLVDQGLVTIEQRTELERLADDRVEEHKGDVQATIAATIDGRSLDALRGAVPALDDGATEAFQAPAGHVLISTIGKHDDEHDNRDRYTLTHLHAKGGMGQVWKARDAALGREIALKELRPEQSSNSVVWSRFLYEAKITAQLEHPGIVPVYEMGEGAAPYYTMRFVKGRTLSEATRNYHKERAKGTADHLGLVNLLTSFTAVCNAVAYAHSRGIIHRDLKGQNVVLGDFGEVIVLDWGLAKRVDRMDDEVEADDLEPGLAGRIAEHLAAIRPTIADDADDDRRDLAGDATVAATIAPGGGLDDDDTTLPPEDDSNHKPKPKPSSASKDKPSKRESGAGPEGTIQGQLLGTPAYMAPEQAEGRHDLVDFRTDVYGLGAILYEVLTGQPPFTAKKTNEVLRMVRQDAPTPPRRINPRITADLEAVCLKALSKSQADRYASAGELAREVQRHLADEPVTAYEDPWTVKAARWARRHRTAVAAASALLVTATLALGLSTAVVTQERNNTRTQEVVARQTIDDMYTKVGESWLEDRLDPIQEEFLKKTLAYFETFTQRAANDPAAQLEHGRTYQRMGDIEFKFGRLAEAEKAYRNGLALLAPLAAAPNASSETRRALAATQTKLAQLLFRTDRFDDARPLYKEAQNLLRPLADGAATTVEDRFLFARALRNEGQLLRRLGDLPAAKRDYLEAVAELDAALKVDPKSAEVRNDLAQAEDYRGRLHRELGERGEAEAALRRSHELISALVVEFPTIPRYREALYHACNDLGRLAYEDGRLDEAAALWGRAYKETDRLAQDFPDRPEYKVYLAGACTNYGGVLADLGKTREAEPILKSGVEINASLAKLSPDDRQVRFDLAKCHFNLGYLYVGQARFDKAVPLIEKARDLNQTLVDELPDVPRHRELQAIYLRRLGAALEASGRPGGEDAYRKSLDLIQRLAARYPDNAVYQLELARCLDGLGGLMVQAEKYEPAEGLFQQGLGALDVKQAPALSTEALREKSILLSNLGSVRRAADKPTAEAPIRQAIAISQALADRKPPARDDVRSLAIAQETLAEALEAKSARDEAAALFQTAVDRMTQLAADAPGEYLEQFYLGYFLEQQGKLLAKLGKPADAKKALESAAAHQREAIKLTDGKVPTYREMLLSHLEALADVDLTLAAYDDVRKAALEMPRTAVAPGVGYFAAAKTLARAATQMHKDAKLDPSRRDDLERKCLGSVVLMLREAIDADPKLNDQLKTEPAFKELLDRSEFQTLLGDLVDLRK
ncbi:MAG: serine/threonine-protein kinase [Paludisphaera borealis]|uniref:serine/threonine-protein kinase n=1 Tax=Paludisphaera borealis TaxID=1387353 RepID=UPI002843B67A|nr:serine/threonine-protein kinase [Paludisphaera borealis]MDR3622284.1 serine/threonine-protein kinase [Paludisphaera borealis]